MDLTELNDFAKEKPDIGVEVLGYSVHWIDPDYNPRGLRVGFLNEDDDGPFISAVWNNTHDCYDTDDTSYPQKWKYLWE